MPFLAYFAVSAIIFVALGIWWSWRRFNKPKGRRTFCKKCHRLLQGDPMFCPWCRWKLRR